MTISIRPPQTVGEFQALEWLQAKIWGPDDVSPVHILLTIAKEGGVVLIALDDEEPVGFAYGFIGLAEDKIDTKGRRIKIASHQAGVLPGYQDRGLGYKIKLAQREATLAKNIDYITWTFDPLQGRNARFNLRKLGTVCNTYLPNLYGEMTDELNQGLPSDRFRVDWWLSAKHVTNRLTGQFVEPKLPPDCPVLNPASVPDSGFSIPPDTFDQPNGNLCLVEIPTSLSALKQEAPDIALKWRLQTRDIFETAFETDYTAVDLLRQEGRNYYLLQKDWQAI